MPDIHFYKDLIAKALLYKSAQSVVREERFEAHAANVVVYTLAKLFAATANGVDLDEVWSAQQVPDCVVSTLRAWCRPVEQRIRSSAGTRNIGEWCKRDDCWVAVRDLDLRVPTAMERHAARVVTSRGGSGHVVGREDVRNIALCKQVTAEEWERIHQWAIRARRLTMVQRGVVQTMEAYAKSGWISEPSIRQARQAVAAIGFYNDREPE